MSENRKPYTRETWPGYRWIKSSLVSANRRRVISITDSGVSDADGDFWTWLDLWMDVTEPLYGSHDGVTWFPCYEGGEASAVQSERVPTPDDAVRCDEASLKAQLSHAQKMHATEVERSRKLAEELTAEISAAQMKATQADAVSAELLRVNGGLKSELDAVKSERDRLQSLVTDLNDKADLADTYERWLLDIGRVIGCEHLDEQLPNCVIRELHGGGDIGQLNGEIDRLQSELAASKAECQKRNHVIRRQTEVFVQQSRELDSERRWQKQLRELWENTNGKCVPVLVTNDCNTWDVTDFVSYQSIKVLGRGETPAAAVEAAAKALGVTFEDEQEVCNPEDVPASVLDGARDAWRLFKRIDAAGLAMGYGAGFSVDGVDFHLTIRRMTFPRFVERSEGHTDAEIGKSLATDENGECLTGWLTAEGEESAKSIIGDCPREVLQMVAILTSLDISTRDHAGDLVADGWSGRAEEAILRADCYRESINALVEVWGEPETEDDDAVAPQVDSATVPEQPPRFTLTPDAIDRAVAESRDKCPGGNGCCCCGGRCDCGCRDSCPKFRAIIRRQLESRHTPPESVAKSLATDEGTDSSGRDDTVPLSSQPGDLIVRRNAKGDFLLILDGRYVNPDVRWNQIGRIYEWMIDGSLIWAETPENHARDESFIREMFARHPVKHGAEESPHVEPDQPPEAAAPEAFDRPNPQIGETWEDGYGNLVGPLESTDSDNAYFKTHPLSYQGFTYMADGRYVDSGTRSEADLVRRVDNIQQPNQEHADGQQQVGGGGVQGQLCASQVGDSAKDQSNKDIQSGTAMDVAVPTPVSAIDHHAAPSPHPGDVTPPLVIEVGGRYLCRDGVTTAEVIRATIDPEYPFRVVFRGPKPDTGVVTAEGKFYRKGQDKLDLIRRLPDVVTVEVDPEIVAFLKSQGHRATRIGPTKNASESVLIMGPGSEPWRIIKRTESFAFVVEPIPAADTTGGV